MAVLSTKDRKALPGKDFAGPDRSYPVNDESHARNALSRVSQYGTAEEKKRVRAKVHAKYPNIGKENADTAGEVTKRLEKRDRN